jgi:hypothetical protein
MPTWSVPSLQDWLVEDWDLFLKSNMAGTLMQEPGGEYNFSSRSRNSRVYEVRNKAK